MQEILNTRIKQELAPSLSIREIEQYYHKNCKKGSLKTGLEYERISLDSRTLDTAGQRELIEIIKNFALINDWRLLIDSNTIIGAHDGSNSITLEPGGQFEISIEAKRNLLDVLENLNYFTRQIDKIGEYYNVLFLSYGINPKTTYPDIEILNKRRYKIMAEYLPKIGRLAPVMMRETAGVQANYDYVSEEDAITKLKIAAYISPFATGFYANSPIRGGRLTEYKSFRALAWKYTGFDRCNLFYQNLINSRMGQGFEDYIRAILNVPMLYIIRGHNYIPIMGKITFKEFMQSGYEGFRATLEDYILHSSLTFPDVRLKNCIEVRNHDSQRNVAAMSVCALYKGILYSKSAMDEILDLLKPLNVEDLEIAGYNSAKFGLDYRVEKLNLGAYEIALKIFEISRKYLPEYEKIFLDKPIWILKNRKCVADILLEKGIDNASSLVEYQKDLM